MEEFCAGRDIDNSCDQLRGFAGQQCGKALPYRPGPLYPQEARLSLAAKIISIFDRKAIGFPHCGAAKPHRALTQIFTTIFFLNSSHIRNSHSRMNEMANASEAGFGGSHDANTWL